MKKTILFAAACALAWPATASAFVAENLLRVNATGATQFEVVATVSAGAKDYWCAAAQYAISQGAVANTRLYLVEGPGPSSTIPGRTAVQFTTDPAAAGITPVNPQLVLSVNVVGDNLATVAAQQYCYLQTRRS